MEKLYVRRFDSRENLLIVGYFHNGNDCAVVYDEEKDRFFAYNLKELRLNKRETNISNIIESNE